MKIIIGSDHGGYEMKELIKTYLISQDYVVEDKGCHNTDSVDYPNLAKDVCQNVLEEKDTLGVLVCGTGIGMSIMANKIDGIRAGLCHTELEAKLTREHNNANILCLGGRIIGTELANAIVDTFIKTKFSNDARHQRRVDMLNCSCELK